jgi:hypothetical protein
MKTLTLRLSPSDADLVRDACDRTNQKTASKAIIQCLKDLLYGATHEYVVYRKPASGYQDSIIQARHIEYINGNLAYTHGKNVPHRSLGHGSTIQYILPKGDHPWPNEGMKEREQAAEERKKNRERP